LRERTPSVLKKTTATLGSGCAEHPLPAFGIPAARTEETAFLIYQQVATIRTLTCYVYCGQRAIGILGVITAVAVLFLQHAANGIGTGKHSMPFLPSNGGTTDTPKVLHNGGHFQTRPQRQRDEPADGLQLGRGTASCLPQAAEDLANPLLISVDRHIDVPAAGRYSFSGPRGSPVSLSGARG